MNTAIMILVSISLDWAGNGLSGTLLKTTIIGEDKLLYS